jgi:hypothetical protein
VRDGGTALRFLLVTAGVVAYGYWATGRTPFGAAAYVAVGIPIVLAAAAVLLGRGWSTPRCPPVLVTVRSAWPWLLIAGLMVGLEIVGLALGGRSATVPTLSTVVDHALAWHLVRLVLFAGWLLIGWSLVGVHRPERGR